MTSNKISFSKLVLFLPAYAFLASVPQNAVGGTLLNDINSFLTGHYPVATAFLSLYDSSGVAVGGQNMDATALLSSGLVNTGTEIVFNGSLTFPELFPLVAGGSGGLLATIHDFSVDLDTAYNSSSIDLVSMQVDWLGSNQPVSENWSLSIGDDFVHGIAHYIYGGNAPQTLQSYGYANIGLEFSTGVTPAPLPATVWLFGSGLAGLIGIAKRRKIA